MAKYKTVDEANKAVAQTIIDAQPRFVGIVRAKEIVPELEDRMILHAGPPIEFKDMPEPVQGSAIGGALFEGWADDEASARKVCETVRFAPNHQFHGVAPMGGIVTANMPVFVIENATDGRRVYAAIHEGEGKVLRYGVYDQWTHDNMVWLRDVLGPALSRAVKLFPDGGFPLNPIIAQAVTMGDDFHVRNNAATSLFARQIAPKLLQAGPSTSDLQQILDFLAGNNEFFLTLAMGAGKAVLDSAGALGEGSVVTCLTRNGRQFAIRVTGLGDQWFTGPIPPLDTMYFPGFTDADACPDCGDSAILESYGFGGMVSVAAPAVQQIIGSGDGTFADALATSDEQSAIVVTNNPNMPIPTWNFKGVPVGLDVRKIIETGITPLVTTPVMHKKAGIGLVGIGKCRAPMECFTSALEALGNARGV
jgi:hypothetical protein